MTLDLTTVLKFHNLHGFVILLSHECEFNTPEPTSLQFLTTSPDAETNFCEPRFFIAVYWTNLSWLCTLGYSQKSHVPPSHPQHSVPAGQCVWARFWVAHTSFHIQLCQGQPLSSLHGRGLNAIPTHSTFSIKYGHHFYYYTILPQHTSLKSCLFWFHVTELFHFSIPSSKYNFNLKNVYENFLWKVEGNAEGWITNFVSFI